MSNKKFFNRDKFKYWNGYIIQSTDISLNQDIISEIENSCNYDILEIGNSGKIKRKKIFLLKIVNYILVIN